MTLDSCAEQRRRQWVFGLQPCLFTGSRLPSGKDVTLGWSTFLWPMVMPQRDVSPLQPTLLVDTEMSALVLKGNQGHAIVATVTTHTLT